MAIERQDYAAVQKSAKSDAAGLLQLAGQNKMSFSQYVNAAAPEVLINEKRSAVEKLMEDIGLFTRSSQVTRASDFNDFIDKGPVGEVLLYDILHRAYKGERQTKSALITGSETPFDSTLYPAVGGTPRVNVNLQAFMDISELLAIEHDITGTGYKPFKWTYDENALKRRRVNPGTALPTATLDYSEDNINLYKWGMGYKVAYEALRAMSTRVDKLAQLMEMEGETERIRKLSQLVGILENGDTRPNSAAESKKASSYDSSITNAGEITAEAWLGFVDDFLPYGITHAIMRASVRRKLFLSTTGSSEVHLAQLININAVGVPSLTDMNPNGSVRIGAVRDEDLEDNKIIGINSNRAVEQVNSAGAEVQEQATNIMNQTQVFTMSDTYNFAKLDFFATKMMTLTA